MASCCSNRLLLKSARCARRLSTSSNSHSNNSRHGQRFPRPPAAAFAGSAVAAIGGGIAASFWMWNSSDTSSAAAALAPSSFRVKAESPAGEAPGPFKDDEHPDFMSLTSTEAVVLSPSEIRFRAFASLEYSESGEPLMTPGDFLDSLIQDRPRPRIKARIVNPRDVGRMLKRTPEISYYSDRHRTEADPTFLRGLGDSGVLTYSEYLFLLSVITKPNSGLKFAFSIMDFSKENTIMGDEFSEFCMMASAESGMTVQNDGRRFSSLDDVANLGSSTTLQVHFFGKDDKHHMHFEEFSAFVSAIQREVLRAEFLEYSRGLDKISEQDFACLLLRYTDLTEEEQAGYFGLLESRLPKPSKRKGITFAELEQFFALLNNISDFALAFRLYPHAGHSLNKQQFTRAAKISSGGTEISENMVDVIFALFDRAGDNCLSYEEFFVVIKNRLRRQIRRSLRRTGWEAFKGCVREEVRTNRSTGKPLKL